LRIAKVDGTLKIEINSVDNTVIEGIFFSIPSEFTHYLNVAATVVRQSRRLVSRCVTYNTASKSVGWSRKKSNPFIARGILSGHFETPFHRYHAENRKTVPFHPLFSDLLVACKPHFFR